MTGTVATFVNVALIRRNSESLRGTILFIILLVYAIILTININLQDT